MNERTLLGPWIRRFLVEHLIGERNLARNTQASYRDTLTLLLPFVGNLLSKPVERLTVEDLSYPSGEPIFRSWKPGRTHDGLVRT